MGYLDGGISEAYVSPQIEQMLGFSREEWLDDPIRWYRQIHPDDRDRWSVEAAEMFLTGQPLKSVYRVLARDGRVVWFHSDAKLVRRKDGQPWFIHGVGFDITELKQTEEALQREIAERERLQKLELERQIAKTEQTESRLAAIVESSEDAIIGKTLDGVITSWNASATRLFGYGRNEIIGKSVLLLIPPELHPPEFEILRKLRAGERIEHEETQRLRKDGERIDVLITISPIKDASGQVIGASSIMRDITEHKRAQERLRVTEKLAARGVWLPLSRMRLITRWRL
jgi:PAS domain S-box-containing protein